MGLESDDGAVVDRGASSLQRGDLTQEQADAEEGPEFLVGTAVLPHTQWVPFEDSGTSW